MTPSSSQPKAPPMRVDSPSSTHAIPSVFAQSAAIPISSTKPRAFSLATLCRKLVLELLRKLDGSQITLVDALGTEVLGENSATIKCRITVENLASYSHIIMNGVNGVGQSYIHGMWSVDNLSGLMRIFIRNRSVLQQMESGFSKFAQSLQRVWHFFNRNTKVGSKKNIAAHYDLGNEFFSQFLDQRMMYSSALYHEGDDLERASNRKLQRICDTLELTSNDHIVEIGSGWGGFACYAANKTGCQVTTITISNEQFIEAQERVKREGLENRVLVKLQDYRDIEGQYDKVVSIEMIEAVGHQYLDTYFNKINQLLKPNGKALIQSIVIDDSQYKSALKRVDFIKRYIFPGGFMPCYSVLANKAAQHYLMLEDLHDMGLSYAQTLRDWRQRFYHALHRISHSGYDLAFQRMWEFYLCYCEGGFDERAISVGQILFRKQAQAT